MCKYIYMKLIQYKDGTQDWADKTTTEIIDGITWLKFETKTKAGKIFKHQVAMGSVAAITDVGEIDREEIQ